MVEKAFDFQSDDGTQVFAKKWIMDEVQPKAIVQLSHGMAEHISRYESFARELVSHNLFVYGNDHRGHGETGSKTNSIGYFADDQGFEKVVQDMYQLSKIIENEYPDTPIFLFGHSMGSLLSRRYMQLYGDKLAGVILSGTAGNPGIMGKLGKMIAAREIKKKGRRVPSPILNNLTFGNFNKSFKPARTDFEWLSRDSKEVDKYIEDPLCGGIFTTGFFYDFLDGIGTINQQQNIQQIPSSLPIFLISGADDPVGGKNGKGVVKTYESFKQAGIKDVSMKLYENTRHEILNELNKEEVQKDIIDWILSHLKS